MALPVAEAAAVAVAVKAEEGMAELSSAMALTPVVALLSAAELLVRVTVLVQDVLET